MSSFFAPHLPPPSSSLPLHRRFGFFKIFFGLIFIAVLAGFAGASVLLAYVWPYYGGIYSSLPATRAALNDRTYLDEAVRHDLNSTVLNIYSGTTLDSGAELLPVKLFVGSAFVVSEDGWVVMYHNAKNINPKNWLTVSASGERYKIAKSVYDNVSGLLFLKLALDSTSARTINLRPIIFETSHVTPDQIYSYSSNFWQGVVVESASVKGITLPHLDTAPAFVYNLNHEVALGSVLVSKTGTAVGFARSSSEVLPANHIQHIWESVRKNNAVRYLSLGVEGWFSAEEPFFVSGELKQGFFVSRVNSATSALRRGDVITEVNGQTISADTLLDLLSPPAVRLTVWRGGASQELTAPVVYFE